MSQNAPPTQQIDLAPNAGTVIQLSPGSEASANVTGQAGAVADVDIGKGSLGGRGIYATRPFAEGEVVVSYELRRLSREEYLALPDSERLFVLYRHHSAA